MGTWESGFYFDQELIKSKHLTSSDVEQEAASAVEALPYIERVYTRTELMRRQSMASIVDDYVARSFFPERGPDLYVVLKPYWLFATEGTSHGSPWTYDTHVPMIFWGDGIRPGRYTYRAGVSDIAPTLAALLGIETPSGSVGHVLTDVVSSTNSSRP